MRKASGQDARAPRVNAIEIRSKRRKSPSAALCRTGAGTAPPLTCRASGSRRRAANTTGLADRRGGDELDVVIQRKLHRVRAHAHDVDLALAFVINPTLNQLLAEDVTFEQERVID